MSLEELVVSVSSLLSSAIFCFFAGGCETVDRACSFFFTCPLVDVVGINVVLACACADLAVVVESVAVNFLFLDDVWGRIHNPRQ